MRHPFPVWPAAILTAMLLAAPAGAADDLAKDRTVYTGQLQTLREAAEQSKSDALVGYRRNVDLLRQKAKQDGDLDAVQALDAEIKRFDQQKMPPASPSGAELAKAAAACRDALRLAEVEGARKVVQLTEKYLAYLDQHVKQSVREEHLDAAKAFRAEMDAAKETPAYQAATFVLAENQPPAEAPPEAAPAPGEGRRNDATNAPTEATMPPPASENARLRSSPDGLYDAARITEGLPAATLAAPSPYRALLAMETGRAPQAGGLVGLALDGYPNGPRYQLRVKLRPKTTAETVQNLKLLVQYFVRNPDGGAIQEAALKFAPVASVSPRSTTCEMQPADLSPRGYTYHTPRGELMIVSGREGSFVGVVVSVFSADDKLLAQVTSFPALKDRGKTAFEAPAQWQKNAVEAPVAPDNGPVIRFRRRIFE